MPNITEIAIRYYEDPSLLSYWERLELEASIPCVDMPLDDWVLYLLCEAD